MKPKEFTLRKLINNKTTIKSPDGSFQGSGGETEVSFTFGEDVDVAEAIKYTNEKADDLKDKDNADWLKNPIK